jgi:hypothetical protein
MEETFTHICNYWKEEEYKKCELEWKQIQTFISNEYTPYQCGRCNTYWKSVAFVNDHDNICPNCDTHCQPFLCNQKFMIAFMLIHIQEVYYVQVALY